MNVLCGFATGCLTVATVAAFSGVWEAAAGSTLLAAVVLSAVFYFRFVEGSA